MPEIDTEPLAPLHHAQAIFAAFDAKDLAGLAALVTDDVRLQIGNAEVVNGKAEFTRALEAFFASPPASGTPSPTCGATLTQ